MSDSTEACCAVPPADVRLPRGARQRQVLLARLAKALGHPTRVRILAILAQRRECVCGDLVDRLDIPQSTASQHLKMLKQAGLIRGTIDGPRICYCIEPAVLAQFKELAAAL